MAQLRGALTPLMYPENYEQFGALTPDENADYWRDTILAFFEETPMIATGIITAFAGSAAPPGWLLCRGQALDPEDYPDLFGIIGYTYGTGSGDDFRVPNLVISVPVGYDPSGGNVEFNALGKAGGEKLHKLLTNEMPSHTHVQNSHNHTQNAHGHTVYGTVIAASGTVRRALAANSDNDVQSANATATNLAATAVNQSAGSDNWHNNMPPYLTVNYIIKT